MLVIFLGKDGGVLASEKINVQQTPVKVPTSLIHHLTDTWNKQTRAEETAFRHNIHLVQLSDS